MSVIDADYIQRLLDEQRDLLLQIEILESQAQDTSGQVGQLQLAGSVHTGSSISRDSDAGIQQMSDSSMLGRSSPKSMSQTSWHDHRSQQQWQQQQLQQDRRHREWCEWVQQEKQREHEQWQQEQLQQERQREWQECLQQERRREKQEQVQQDRCGGWEEPLEQDRQQQHLQRDRRHCEWGEWGQLEKQKEHEQLHQDRRRQERDRESQERLHLSGRREWQEPLQPTRHGGWEQRLQQRETLQHQNTVQQERPQQERLQQDAMQQDRQRRERFHHQRLHKDPFQEWQERKRRDAFQQERLEKEQPSSGSSSRQASMNSSNRSNRWPSDNGNSGFSNNGYNGDNGSSLRSLQEGQLQQQQLQQQPSERLHDLSLEQERLQQKRAQLELQQQRLLRAQTHQTQAKPKCVTQNQVLQKERHCEQDLKLQSRKQPRVEQTKDAHISHIPLERRQDEMPQVQRIRQGDLSDIPAAMTHREKPQKEHDLCQISGKSAGARQRSSQSARGFDEAYTIKREVHLPSPLSQSSGFVQAKTTELQTQMQRTSVKSEGNYLAQLATKEPQSQTVEDSKAQDGNEMGGKAKYGKGNGGKHKPENGKEENGKCKTEDGEGKDGEAPRVANRVTPPTADRTECIPQGESRATEPANERLKTPHSSEDRRTTSSVIDPHEQTQVRNDEELEGSCCSEAHCKDPQIHSMPKPDRLDSASSSSSCTNSNKPVGSWSSAASTSASFEKAKQEVSSSLPRSGKPLGNDHREGWGIASSRWLEEDQCPSSRNSTARARDDRIPSLVGAGIVALICAPKLGHPCERRVIKDPLKCEALDSRWFPLQLAETI